MKKAAILLLVHGGSVRQSAPESAQQGSKLRTGIKISENQSDKEFYRGSTRNRPLAVSTLAISRLNDFDHK